MKKSLGIILALVMMVALANFLSHTDCLRELSLWNVGLDLEGVQNLSASLSELYDLKSLNVGSNFMGDDGARALTTALKKVGSQAVS